MEEVDRRLASCGPAICASIDSRACCRIFSSPAFRLASLALRASNAPEACRNTCAMETPGKRLRSIHVLFSSPTHTHTHTHTQTHTLHRIAAQPVSLVPYLGFGRGQCCLSGLLGCLLALFRLSLDCGRAFSFQLLFFLLLFRLFKRNLRVCT